MGTFLSLEDNAYFVRGPINGAIYDLDRERIQPVPKTLADILESCILKGTSLDAAIEGVLSSMSATGRGKMRDIVVGHPLLYLSEMPQPCPPIQPLMNEQLGQIWLELTSECNLRCRHCYASAGPDAAHTDSLPSEKWMDIVKGAAEIGFTKIQFTGGEPLLYPGLIDLIHTAEKCGYEYIEVYSNLTLLSDELVDAFKRFGVSVATSFYSYDRQTHNEITRNKTSYDRTLDGIKKVVNAEIPIRIGVILMEQNLSHGEKTKELLESLGVPSDKIGFDFVRCSGRGADSPQADNMRADSYPVGLRKNDQGRIVWNSCWPGKVAIKSDGSVSPCVFVREAIDNVNGKRLEDSVLGEDLKTYWSINLGKVKICRDCEFRYGCMDCRANVLNSTGDLYAKNPFCSYNPYTGVWNGSIGEDNDNGDVRPKKKLDVNWEKLDDSSVIYGSDGNLAILNSTGAMVWELCDGEHNIEDITDEFLSIYEADRELVYTDVRRLVEQLTMRELLEN